MVEEQAVAGPTDGEKSSRWEDYIDVFMSPAELFRRRAADKVSVPLFTLFVIGIVLYFAMLPANQMIMRTAMAANPQGAEFMERWGGIFSVVGAVTVPIIYSIMIFFGAAVLWLVGRFASVRIDYNRAALITTYAAYVAALGGTLALVAVILHGADGLDPVRHISLGPLRFLGSADMDPLQVALLRRFEIFTLWQTAIWAIGIREIYRTTTGKAALIAVVAWIIAGLPGIISAALGFGQQPGVE